MDEIAAAEVVRSQGDRKIHMSHCLTAQMTPTKGYCECSCQEGIELDNHF